MDRAGRLLRPYATAEGRWRLPARPEEVEATKKKLARYGLKVAVFRGEARAASRTASSDASAATTTRPRTLPLT